MVPLLSITLFSRKTQLGQVKKSLYVRQQWKRFKMNQKNEKVNSRFIVLSL